MSRTAVPEPPQDRTEAEEARWPLKFKFHYFGAHCFDTQACQILYRGFQHGNPSPSPPIASFGRPLDKLLSAGRGPIPNFPPPAQVRWRSRSGTPLEADVDFAQIFEDELIRHRLRKEEMPEATLASDHAPAIILEVNDRTINVYMRAHLSTRELQIPGNRHSDFRDDLIKVFSRTY
ncbi:hypothetical protein [Lysobacter humi (ex Lee et al. 2017)]